MKTSIISIVILFTLGCGTDKKDTLSAFNKLKNEVKQNYTENKNIFSDLKSYFALKYIKVIDFKKDNFVAIQYKMSDKSDWHKTEINLADTEVKTPLKEEGISAQNLINLKNKLDSINADRIWIIDDYDITRGFDFKKMELKYLKKVNDLHFFYMMFDRPLDSIERSHYTLQTQNNIGGVLDKDVVFYYK